MPVAAITGLAAEARIARELGMRAAAGSGDAARTTAAIAQLIGGGATGLVSFGICGGLDPAIASGAVVLPRTVRTETGARYPVDGKWHAALAAALRSTGMAMAIGDMLGSAAIVDTPAGKAARFAASGAVAVDLESHLAAQAALAAGIPFVVVRCVADGPGRRLPPAVLVGLDAAGRLALGPVLGSLLRDPGQIPALLQVALDTRRAFRALRRAALSVRAHLVTETGR
jgi:adenosylhomocysteine nucleosidase